MKSAARAGAMVLAFFAGVLVEWADGEPLPRPRELWDDWRKEWPEVWRFVRGRS